MLGENTFKPVQESERISSIDTLRGVSLLGILIVNIQVFAYPSTTLFNPMTYGDFTGLNQGAWTFVYLFFNQKMMTIFSMLFGAGVILMHQRAVAKDVNFCSVYYRRLLWLFLIGMVHAYLIWYGDILVPYALCGLLLYPMRKLKPVWLITIGIFALLIGMSIMMASGFFFTYVKKQFDAVAAAEAEGREPSQQEKEFAKVYEEIKTGFSPTEEIIQDEIDAMTSSYPDMVSRRFLFTLIMQFQSTLFYLGWRALGMMLIGMALMKLGIFSAEKSLKFYIGMSVIGYAVGLTLTGLGASGLIEQKFNFAYYFREGSHFDYIGSVIATFGHVGFVMAICKTGALKWLRERLAAVGRMAFTNYLTESILMTFVFYGWGLGYFAQIDRFNQLFLVLGVWVLILIISPIWLRHFKYGPAEWLWRSLTYREKQPFRRNKEQIDVMPESK